jgi:hypothetical protein
MLFLIFCALLLAALYKGIKKNWIFKDGDWIEETVIMIIIMIIVVAILSPALIYLLPNEIATVEKQKICPMVIGTNAIYVIKDSRNTYWHFVKKTEGPIYSGAIPHSATIEYLRNSKYSGYLLLKKIRFKNKFLNLLFNTPNLHFKKLVFQIPPGSVAEVMRQ